MNAELMATPKVVAYPSPNISPLTCPFFNHPINSFLVTAHYPSSLRFARTHRLLGHTVCAFVHNTLCPSEDEQSFEEGTDRTNRANAKWGRCTDEMRLECP